MFVQMVHGCCSSDGDMKIVQDKIRGEVAVLENDSHYSKWVEEHQSLCTDKTVPERLLPLIPVGGTVIDAGANIGTHTVQYAEKVGPEGTVVAFEPCPATFDCLAFNCRNLPQVWKYQGGLADKEGLGKLLLPSDTNMGAVALEFCNDGDVELWTVDELVLGRCDFIKIDVEGFEVVVLQGASGTISEFKPIIYIELNDGALQRMGRTKQDILGFMERHDYTHQFLDPAHDFKMSQVDVLFRAK